MDNKKLGGKTRNFCIRHPQSKFPHKKEENTMEPMAFIGAGMCALSMMAAAWGVSQVWTTIISTVGRNPQVKKDIDIYGWVGFAAVEAIALYALVIALVMLSSK